MIQKKKKKVFPSLMTFSFSFFLYFVFLPNNLSHICAVLRLSFLFSFFHGAIILGNRATDIFPQLPRCLLGVIRVLNVGDILR